MPRLHVSADGELDPARRELLARVAITDVELQQLALLEALGRLEEQGDTLLPLAGLHHQFLGLRTGQHTLPRFCAHILAAYIKAEGPPDACEQRHLTCSTFDHWANHNLHAGTHELVGGQNHLNTDALVRLRCALGHQVGNDQLLEGGAAMGERLLGHEKRQAWWYGYTHSGIPGAREGGQGHIGLGWDQRIAFFSDQTPSFVASNLTGELRFLQEDEAMIREHMNELISPAVQRANQSSDPIHLDVEMSDQRGCTAVANVIDLIMAHHNEQIAEIFGRLVRGFDRFDLAAVGTKTLHELHAFRALGAVFSVHKRLQVIGAYLQDHVRARDRHQGGHADGSDGGQLGQHWLNGHVLPLQQACDGEGAVVAEGIDDDHGLALADSPEPLLQLGCDRRHAIKGR